MKEGNPTKGVSSLQGWSCEDILKSDAGKDGPISKISASGFTKLSIVSCVWPSFFLWPCSGCRFCKWLQSALGYLRVPWCSYVSQPVCGLCLGLFVISILGTRKAVSGPAFVMAQQYGTAACLWQLHWMGRWLPGQKWRVSIMCFRLACGLYLVVSIGVSSLVLSALQCRGMG